MRLRTLIPLFVLFTLLISCAGTRHDAAAARRDAAAAAPTLEDQLPKLAFRPPPDFAAVPDSFWINGSATVQVKLAADGHVRVARIYTAYVELKDPRPEWAGEVDSIVVNAARRAIFTMPKNKVNLEEWIPFDYALPGDATGWPHDRLVGWTGRVVDAQRGTPVSGAVVRVVDERLGAQTDARGIARIPSLRAGRFAIVTLAPFFATRSDSVTVTAGRADTSVVRLAPWTGPGIVDTLWNARSVR